MRALALTLLLFLSTLAVSGAATLTDPEDRTAIIQESLSSYSAPCPCPYSIMRNGRACGRRSAYVRPGGASPICYDRDVSAAMIQSYRASHH